MSFSIRSKDCILSRNACSMIPASADNQLLPQDSGCIGLEQHLRGGRMTLATAQTIRAIRSNILAIGLNRMRRTSPSFSIAVDWTIAVAWRPRLLRAISRPLDSGAYRKARPGLRGDEAAMMPTSDFSGLLFGLCLGERGGNRRSLHSAGRRSDKTALGRQDRQHRQHRCRKNTPNTWRGPPPRG
jgi:hypothetical protein